MSNKKGNGHGFPFCNVFHLINQSSCYSWTRDSDSKVERAREGTMGNLNYLCILF